MEFNLTLTITYLTTVQWVL